MYIKRNKFHRQPYSFRHRVLQTLALIFLSFIIIIGWLYSYFNNILLQKTYNNIKDTLQVYNHQLSGNLDDLDIFLYEMNSYSLEISNITSTADVNKIYNNIMRVKDLLNYSLPSFTEIDGMFVYTSINDTFIQSYKTTDNTVVSNYLRKYLRGLNSESKFNELNIKTWFTKEVNQSYYLIRIIKVNNTYLGAWSKIDSLTSSFKNISELEGNVIFVDRKGKPLCNNDLSHYTFHVKTLLEQYSIFKMNDKSKSLLVTNELDYCDYYLVALIPIKNISLQFKTIYQVLLLMSIIIIMLLLILMISFSKFLSKPLLLLNNTLESIRQGNFDKKVPSDISNCKEIIEIDTVFNNMLDEIHNLRINIYEEKISRSQIELQYLKSQIAPHFLINCLYSIASLAEDNTKNTILQQMVQTLSKHLRYTLSDRTVVSLEEELVFIDNYIELSKLRFPGCLTYEPDISPDTKDASVFPLILLMLTENSIKYNLVMGEFLLIKISSHLVIKEGEKWIHLTHIDSGEGFSPDMLQMINHIDRQSVAKQNGDHLGILNVSKRLRLVYGETAVIHFSNEQGMGARIDIEIPLIPYNSFHALEGR